VVDLIKVNCVYENVFIFCHFQILIEASPASSFELSPHFSNSYRGTSNHGKGIRGSGDSSGSLAGMQDLEHELQEAMSETVVGEESLLDGEP